MIKAKKIYLIGIKGTGMSSLAVLLKKLGHRVTGSDTKEKFFTEAQLKLNSIKHFSGFSERNLAKAKPQLIVYSTAYTDSNPEIALAKKLKTPMLSYPEAVGEISRTLNSVAVCGSHGKTTTTSMLAWIMESTGRSSALIGTTSKLNRASKNPKFFVFEADEYQNKLRYYSPTSAIITNIDYDHPDYFKTPAQYLKVFKDFAFRTLKNNGYILYCHDAPAARGLLKHASGNLESYGFDAKSDWRITDIQNNSQFTLRRKNIHQRQTRLRRENVLDITLSTYGKHNVLNAAATAVMALHFGVPKSKIVERLASFKGAKRRMELIHSKNYLLIDDYGHHPAEIKATLSALRAKYPKQNIVAIFHPHTFTRTKKFLKEFGKSFKDADLTIVLDIFPSAREKTGTVHSRDLVKEIRRNGSKSLNVPTAPEVARYIKSNVSKSSLILTIGAGDVFSKIHKLL